MIIYNNLQTLLATYSTPPCFYEYLASPSDMYLQTPVAGNTVEVQVWDVNGTTLKEDITTLTTIVTANGKTNVRLNAYSDYMCECRKFIIRVIVSGGGASVIGEYWFGVFKIDSCCESVYVVDIDGDIVGNDEPVSPNAPRTGCRLDNLKIVTWNLCFDKFTGERFDNGFKKIANVEGRIIRMPTTITKEISLNNKVLKSQSFPKFKIEGFEYMPAHKMAEIENMFHHEFIEINGERYIFEGGILFAIVEGVCDNLYYMDGTLRGNSQYQTFGCPGECDTEDSGREFYYPLSSCGNFYSENREFIGDSEALAAWLGGYNGVTSSTINEETGLLELITTGSAPVIYACEPTVGSIVYPMVDEEAATEFYYNPCTSPTVGAVSVTIGTCAAPVISIYEVTYSDDVPSTCVVGTLTFSGTAAFEEYVEYCSNSLVNATVILFTVNDDSSPVNMPVLNPESGCVAWQSDAAADYTITVYYTVPLI